MVGHSARTFADHSTPPRQPATVEGLDGPYRAASSLSSIRLIQRHFSARARPLQRLATNRSTPVYSKRIAPMSCIRAVFLAMALAAPALAAPLDPGAVAPSGPVVEIPTDPSTGGSKGSAASTKRDSTIDLLLRAQGPDGAASQVPPRPVPEREGSPEAGRGNLPPPGSPGVLQELKDLKTSVFGESSTGPGDTGSTHSAGGDQGAADRLADAPAGNTPAGAMPGRSADGSTGTAGLLTNPVVRFIRTNRTLSIAASIAVLAAVWLLTTYRSRSRRSPR